MATQRYSITTSGGATHFTFTSPPPPEVRDVLRTSPDCRWLPFQKQWKCANDRLRQRIERLLADAGWAMGQSVAPELAPLSVRTSTDATGAVRLAFNRRFAGERERELADKLRAVACMDAGDRMVWLCAAAKEAEVRNLLSQYGVGDSTAAPPPGSIPVQADGPPPLAVNMATKGGNAVTLTFAAGLPPPERLAELRGALAALGFVVTARTDLGGGATSDDEGAPPASAPMTASPPASVPSAPGGPASYAAPVYAVAPAGQPSYAASGSGYASVSGYATAAPGRPLPIKRFRDEPQDADADYRPPRLGATHRFA